MQILKDKVKKIIPKTLLKKYYKLKTPKELSFSQFGEDLILKTIFQNKNKGFYVDIGAFHPKELSNTYFFYKKGWKGINVEPISKTLKLFHKYRKKDINLECLVYSKEKIYDFYIFKETSISTLSKDVAEEKIKLGYKLNYIKKIPSYTLSNILDKYLPKNVKIDFLSIDTQGNELNILRGIDFNKYKFQYMSIEHNNREPIELI